MDEDKKPFVHRRKVDTLTPCRKTAAIGKMSKSAATRDRNVRRTVGDTAALQQQSWFLKLCTFAHFHNCVKLFSFLQLFDCASYWEYTLCEWEFVAIWNLANRFCSAQCCCSNVQGVKSSERDGARSSSSFGDHLVPLRSWWENQTNSTLARHCIYLKIQKSR